MNNVGVKVCPVVVLKYLEKLPLMNSKPQNGNSVVRSMLTGFRTEWYAAYRLAKRSFAERYKNSRFGMLWEFLDPLVLALIFILLHEYRGISVKPTGIPYPVFVVTGLLLWQTFIDGLLSGMKCIMSQRHILAAIKVKPELLVLSTVYTVGFSSLFRLAIALGVGIVLLDPGVEGLLFFSLGLIYLAVLGLGIGFLIAPFATVNGDIRHVVGIVTRPMMFVSSVIFPLPDGPVFDIFRIVNPVAASIENIRQLLATGTLVDGSTTVVILVSVAGLLFLAGWYAVHVTLPIVGDQK